jgi:hypothetical protein
MKATTYSKKLYPKNLVKAIFDSESAEEHKKAKCLLSSEGGKFFF